MNVSSSLPIVATPWPNSAPSELDWTSVELEGASGSVADSAGAVTPLFKAAGCCAEAVTASVMPRMNSLAPREVDAEHAERGEESP